MVPIDVKKMSYEELQDLKELIDEEVNTRSKEQLIENFKSAWRALEDFGLSIRTDSDNEILDVNDIYYVDW